jgi:hypothetical protein
MVRRAWKHCQCIALGFFSFGSFELILVLIQHWMGPYRYILIQDTASASPVSSLQLYFAGSDYQESESTLKLISGFAGLHKLVSSPRREAVQG